MRDIRRMVAAWKRLSAILTATAVVFLISASPSLAANCPQEPDGNTAVAFCGTPGESDVTNITVLRAVEWSTPGASFATYVSSDAPSWVHITYSYEDSEDCGCHGPGSKGQTQRYWSAEIGYDASAPPGACVPITFYRDDVLTTRTHTVVFPRVPAREVYVCVQPPSISPVKAWPYEAIGATYFGWNGSNQTVSGSGFAPNETVNLSLNGTRIASSTSDGSGNVSIPFTVPEEPNGLYKLTATGAAGRGDTASTTLTSSWSTYAVITDASCDETTQNYAVSTSWDGAGLNASSTYTFALSNGLRFTATTARDGSFSKSFVAIVPAQPPPANDAVTATISGPIGSVPNVVLASLTYGYFPGCGAPQGGDGGGGGD